LVTAGTPWNKIPVAFSMLSGYSQKVRTGTLYNGSKRKEKNGSEKVDRESAGEA
jgi:hypothetical protein